MEHIPNIFKLYIDKYRYEITVTRNNEVFFVFNYYTDTVDHRIPHVLHKALTEKIIIPAIGFDLSEVYSQCRKYFIRVANAFTDVYSNATSIRNNLSFDPDFLMLYDLFYCNIIVNNEFILPAVFKHSNDSITLSKLDFSVMLEDLDRHIAEYRYGLYFPKYFRMDLSLINRIWYEKIYC